jgi:uncharacterized protein
VQLIDQCDQPIGPCSHSLGKVPCVLDVDVTTAPSTRTWRALGVGAAAGLLSGLFGVGGGLVIVPGLMGLLSMERKVAHGTSLAATVVVAAASAATYVASDDVDWPITACFASGAVAGAIIGTHLLKIIPRRPLIVVFVATILATAIRLLLVSDSGGRNDLTIAMGAALVLFGVVTGTLSGLLGVGGGVVMVPVMVVLLSMPTVVAKGTSVATIVPSSLVGTIRNRSNRNVDLRIGAIVGAAGILTAVVGGRISQSIADSVSNALFALLLVIVAGLQIRDLRRPELESVEVIEP